MSRRRRALCLAVLVTLSLAGCASPSRVTYIPEGDSYSADVLLEALQLSDPGPAADVATDEAFEVRQEALTDLRKHGEDAAALADMLTSEFPPDDDAVPYRIEHGTFDDKPAWIVFEAWGEPGGSLAHRRVWAISSEDFAILAAQSAL